MKFLAILKDSLRETLDVKLLYVLIGLSALVVLFAGSVTYKPVTVEEQTRFIFEKLINMQMELQLQQKFQKARLKPTFVLSNFERTDTGDPARPWEGNYQFNYSLKLEQIGAREAKDIFDKADVEEFDKAREEIARELRPQDLEQLFSAVLSYLKNVHVERIDADDKNELRFQITSKGTHIESAKGWFYRPYLFFGLVDTHVPFLTLGHIVEFIGDKIIGWFGAAFTMLVSTIMTASFLPNMLNKGTVDLLLVKPIHRTTLFLYKFLGGLLFMVLNTVVIIVGIYLALGLQTGLWTHSLLLCIPVFTLQFTIFYSVMALAAVLTRSAVVSIFAAMLVWGLLFFVGYLHWFLIEKGRTDKPASTKSHWAYVGFDLVKTALPRYKDLDWLTTKLIKTNLVEMMYPAGAERDRQLKEQIDKEGYDAYNWPSALTATFAFIALMLALACWRFATKDY
jgi:ABC-type transport system involved in multi-copper enzyme maturation permease subunit